MFVKRFIGGNAVLVNLATVDTIKVENDFYGFPAVVATKNGEKIALIQRDLDECRDWLSDLVSKMEERSLII